VKRPWLALALLVSVGINLGFLGVALVRHRAIERWREVRAGELPPPPEFGRRLADGLHLSPRERPRFLELQRGLAEHTLSGRREIFRLREQLRAELLAPQPDRARIDPLIAKLDERQSALNRALVDTLLESRRMLSGDELQEYLRMLDRFAPGRGPAGASGPYGRGPGRRLPGGDAGPPPPP